MWVRYATTAAVNTVHRSSRHRKWLWYGSGIAATASIAALSSSSPQQQVPGTSAADQEAVRPKSVLGYLQQQLSKAAASIWPPGSSSSSTQQQQQQQSESLAGNAISKARATSARWLAQWAEDPEAREALLAFGSNYLLGFLVNTATEDPSTEQAHAEQALCNFLRGYHTSSRLLARPGAIPQLLNHVATGKASDELVEGLGAVLLNRSADFTQQGLVQDDGRQLINMLEGRHGRQVQLLSLQFLTAWSAAGEGQCRQLSRLGLGPALGHLAMEAVGQGEQGRELQAAVCRLQRILVSQPGIVSDADLAAWMQPLLFMAADAAAAAAAAAAGASKGVAPHIGSNSNSSSGSSSSSSGVAGIEMGGFMPGPLGALAGEVSSTTSITGSTTGSTVAAAAAGNERGGVGVLGAAAGAADLAVADVAMTTLAAAVAAGGSEVRAALSGLHLLPTLDCLALSPDPAMKARAAATFAALTAAGQLDSEEARSRWRDMLLTWLMNSTASALKKQSSSSSVVSGGSSSNGSGSWLSGWFGSSSSSSSSDDLSPSPGGQFEADAALAKSCVAGLRVLSQEPGPAGLAVAQLWLSCLLLQLSSRVAAYTSITTLGAQPTTSSSSSSSLVKHAALITPKSARADAHPAAAAAAGSEVRKSSAAADVLHDVQQGVQQTVPLVLPDVAAAAAAGTGAGSTNPAGSTDVDSSSSSTPAAGGVEYLSSTEPGSSSSGISSGSSWWSFGGRWWWWGSSSSTDGAHNPSNNMPYDNYNGTSVEDVLQRLDAAEATHWRDAAPMTPAYARAAAEELKLASIAMVSSWRAAALALPSDLVPGMFAPAVVEAYPAAARVVDFAVAQQRTTNVMELLASVVAEDPTKQAWLLVAGILPIMERLVLHADAGLDPEAFIAKYSSSSSSKGAGSSSSSTKMVIGGGSSSDGGGSSSGGDSRTAGASWWWWGSSSSSSNAAAAADAVRKVPQEGTTSDVTVEESSSAEGSTAGSSSGSTAYQQQAVQAVQLGDHPVQQSCTAAAPTSATESCSHDSSRQDAAAVDAWQSTRGPQQQQQLVFHCELGCEVHPNVLTWRDFECYNSAAVSDRSPPSLSWLAAGGVLSKFRAAALSKQDADLATAASATTLDNCPGEADISSSSSSSRGGGHMGKVSGTAEASGTSSPTEVALQQQQQQQYIPPAVLMGFAQGASWDFNASALDSRTTASQLTPSSTDAATAITAAAEEYPSWIDGEGLGFLCLQRQVARVLGMIALQPAAAQQLAESALLPDSAEGGSIMGGAVRVLESLGDALNPIKPGSRPQTQVVLLQPEKLHRKRGYGSNRGGSSSSSGSWLPWLLAAAASDDCLLSSYATVALLHLEAAIAHNQQDIKVRHFDHGHPAALLQQQQQQHLGGSSSSSGDLAGIGSRWKERIRQELHSAEDLAAFVEDLWPFSSSRCSGSSGGNGSSSSSSSNADGVWRPAVYYPDGIHLFNPTSGHHWGLLQPPKTTLLESLSAAATAAASAAVAAAASDLSQSDIDMSDGAAAAAAAEANTAAGEAAGASDDAALPGAHGSSSSSAELGVLQPAVVWLAQKLVKLAEIKHDPATTEQQRQGSSSSSDAANPAAPLSTYSAVQALLSGSIGGSSSSGGESTAAGADPQQQQQQGLTAPASPPEFDIVFIHGIRGGPFVSWRKGGGRRLGSSTTEQPSAAAAAGDDADSSSSSRKLPLSPSAAVAVHRHHMTRGDCWPASWLAADLPGARLISVEYKAPVTGWEGESLSLPDSGRLLLDKLLAAGVGQRPVVLVAHSMGGLLVKEMLSLSLDEPPNSKRARLAQQTKAIAFYSTPHFGSSMASWGWKLRHLPGASPAPSIHHLSPGPHLAALNARLAVLHEFGRVQVLSFTEGLATSLAGLGFIPKILIVPFESAYPGFGAVHVLSGQDHIDVCKPENKQADGYAKLVEFIRASMAAAGVGGDASSSSNDSSAAAAAAGIAVEASS